MWCVWYVCICGVCGMCAYVVWCVYVVCVVCVDIGHAHRNKATGTCQFLDRRESRSNTYLSTGSMAVHSCAPEQSIFVLQRNCSSQSLEVTNTGPSVPPCREHWTVRSPVHFLRPLHDSPDGNITSITMGERETMVKRWSVCSRGRDRPASSMHTPVPGGQPPAAPPQRET